MQKTLCLTAYDLDPPGVIRRQIWPDRRFQLSAQGCQAGTCRLGGVVHTFSAVRRQTCGTGAISSRSQQVDAPSRLCSPGRSDHHEQLQKTFIPSGQVWCDADLHRNQVAPQVVVQVLSDDCPCQAVACCLLCRGTPSSMAAAAADYFALAINEQQVGPDEPPQKLLRRSNSQLDRVRRRWLPGLMWGLLLGLLAVTSAAHYWTG